MSRQEHLRRRATAQKVVPEKDLVAGVRSVLGRDTGSRHDVLFLLRQLSLQEHAQDRSKIKEIAARHGVEWPYVGEIE